MMAGTRVLLQGGPDGVAHISAILVDRRRHLWTANRPARELKTVAALRVFAVLEMLGRTPRTRLEFRAIRHFGYSILTQAADPLHTWVVREQLRLDQPWYCSPVWPPSQFVY